MSYFIIIFLTLLVTTRRDIMYENITGVSALPQYRALVVIYILVCTFYFMYQMFSHFRHLHTYPRYVPYLIFLTALFMIMGAFSPYDNQLNFMSQVHVWCSMLASCLFLIILQIYTYRLSIESPDMYLHTHSIFHVGLQMLAILFLVCGRVNGLIELLYVVMICTYLFLIDRHQKNKLGK